MTTVPIIFAIDRNVVMQCGVTLTSLILNAREESFYDIYILHSQQGLPESDRARILTAFPGTDHYRVSFIDTGNAFHEAEGLATGHITTATYYRLAIPSLFPQFERVIYSDIDIIFQDDLSELFLLMKGDPCLLAAATDFIDLKRIDDTLSSLCDADSFKDQYFNAGFLVMNLDGLREEKIQSQLHHHAGIKYEQNDQDVLNIVCKGHVRILPPVFNFQPNQFAHHLWGKKVSGARFKQLFAKGTLHYTGPHKPWNSLECVAPDAWWHYYRQSPFYEDSFYFKCIYDQIEAARNDYRNRSNSDLLRRVLVNIKRSLVKK